MHEEGVVKMDEEGVVKMDEEGVVNASGRCRRRMLQINWADKIMNGEFF